MGKVVDWLSLERQPWQVALATCLGMIFGLTPFFSLHNLVLIFLVCLIRVNLLAFLVSFGVFKILSLAMYPFFHFLGYQLLVEFSFLQPIWALAENTYILPYFKFNNTVVLGSLVASLVLFGPLFLSVDAVSPYMAERWKSRKAKGIKGRLKRKPSEAKPEAQVEKENPPKNDSPA